MYSSALSLRLHSVSLRSPLRLSVQSVVSTVKLYAALSRLYNRVSSGKGRRRAQNDLDGHHEAMGRGRAQNTLTTVTGARSCAKYESAPRIVRPARLPRELRWLSCVSFEGDSVPALDAGLLALLHLALALSSALALTSALVLRSALLLGSCGGVLA